MATITQKGLGKGLSALISENYVQPSAPKKQEPANTQDTGAGVYSQPLARLHPGKYQPRRAFDDTALNELADSIRKNGIMQPIVVRHSKQAGQYEIIAGERRWRAAKLAGLSEVPVLIRDIDDKQALELALVENIQRQDLTPLEEAAGYQQLIEEFEYTQEELAQTVGKSRSHVANLLRLLALPDEVKAMLDKGELTMGHARALLTADNPAELARSIIEKGLNVRQAEAALRQVKNIEKKTIQRGGSGPRIVYVGGGSKDPDIMALEESLSENLGLKVSINDRGQSGEIILSYESLSQLDDILRRLGDTV